MSENREEVKHKLLRQRGQHVKDDSNAIFDNAEHMCFQGEYVADAGHVKDRGNNFQPVSFSRKEYVYGEEGRDGLVKKRLSQLKYQTVDVGFDSCDMPSKKDACRQSFRRDAFFGA